MLRVRALGALFCGASLVGCVGEAPLPEPAAEGKAPVSAKASVSRAGTPSYVPIAYMEGYGNPKTGELWVRTVPIAQDEAPEGVGVSGSNLSGYCSVTVESDGKVRDNPPGTFEYYTLGEVAGAPAAHHSSFDPTVCTNTLPGPLQAALGPDFNDPGIGVGCAYQHVMNFTSKTYDRVLLDIDVFNGEEDKHGAWGVSTTQGTINTLEGRNAPHAQSGLWDFGKLEPGEESNMWIYFKNGDTNDFNWTGFLLGEIYEDCGDMDDEDCDGVDDNGCYDANNGDGCYDHSDCGSGYCDGFDIVSNIGNAGQALGDDQMGMCTTPMAPQTTSNTLATNGYDTCNLTSTGEFICWGGGIYSGQATPQPIGNDANAFQWGGVVPMQFDAGGAHMCMVTSDNNVRCWGLNSQHQVDGMGVGGGPAENALPGSVLSGAVHVETGADFTCALMQDGKVTCWGDNDNGQAGNGGFSDRAPMGQVLLPGGTAAVQLCAGTAHACALLDNNEVSCWGYGGGGQLGLGSTANVNDPSSVAFAAALSTVERSAGRTIKTLGCGGQNTWVIMDDGSVRTWGFNDQGQLGYGPGAVGNFLGDDELPNATEPLVAYPAPAVQLTAGDYVICALLNNGDVYCTGWPRYGQHCLGHNGSCANVPEPRPEPINFGYGRHAVELASRVGTQNICAKLDNGGVKCWGTVNATAGTNVMVENSTSIFLDPPPIDYAYNPEVRDESLPEAVLGQDDWITNGANKGASLGPAGMDNVFSVAVDHTSGKVFVADTNNNRVLRFTNYDALTDGMDAEAVVGQPDLMSNTPNNVDGIQRGLSHPFGIFVDHRGTLWVADTDNDRVLGFYDAANLSNAPEADKILGQETTTSAELDQSTIDRLNGPHGVFVTQEDRLFVADTFNNRVVKYQHARFWPDGHDAAAIYGQPGAGSSGSGGGLNQMNTPRAVFANVYGDLFVADLGNHRVLRFASTWANTGGTSANQVIGQANAGEVSSGGGVTGFNFAGGVSGSRDGDVLLVSDSSGNRVAAFIDVRNAGNKPNISAVVGQSSTLGSVAQTTQGGFSDPAHVFYDEYNDAIYVADRANNRIVRYNPPADAPQGGPGLVLGQPNFTDTALGDTATDIHAPSDVAVDPTTRKVFVADTNNHRVLRYKSYQNLSNGDAAERVLGQPGFGTPASGTSDSLMKQPNGIHVDMFGTLWVADTGNNRILRFDDAANIGTNGAAANQVIGQPDFDSGGAGAAADKFNVPFDVFVTDGQTLWVSGYINNRVLRFDDAYSAGPTSSADGVLGQSLFTTSGNDLSDSGMYLPRGISVDTNGTLWVGDHNNMRVLRFDNPNAKSDGDPADGVLGKADFISDSPTPITASNTSQCSGVAVTSDGWVYVSDTGNNRILAYDPASAVMSGQDASFVLGQPGFTSGGVGGGMGPANGYSGPFGLHVDVDDNLWIADRANNRVLMHGY